MLQQYRVVCCENKNKKLFVDIYPADFSNNAPTHDILIKMRRMITPDANPIISGIILTDLGNKNISLKYEPVYSYRLRQYQEFIRTKVDSQIYKTFQQMKNQGARSTIEINSANWGIIFDMHASSSPQSAREKLLIDEKLNYKKYQENRQHLIESKANSPYASKPHILLALKQAKYRGD